MKTAILYASTHGTTKKVATMMAEKIGQNNCTLFDLKQSGIIPISDFDQLIIGGSIHAGQMQRRIKTYLDENTVAILEKRFALFMVCMNEPDVTAQLNRSFPDVLQRKAISVRAVGGEFIFEKMNFLERLIVRKLSGFRSTVSKLKLEEIDNLVNDIQTK